MRYAVDEDRVQAGVGEDDLLLAAGGGSPSSWLHEHGLDLRQAAQEAVAHGARALAQLRLVLDRVGKRQVHLLAQVGVDLAEQELRKRLGRDVRHRAAREIRREEHLLQVLDDLDDDLAVGHAQLLAVHGHFGRFVAVGDLCRHGVQQTFCVMMGTLLLLSHSATGKKAQEAFRFLRCMTMWMHDGRTFWARPWTSAESDASLRTTTTGRRTCRDPDAAAAAKTHCSDSFRSIFPLMRGIPLSCITRYAALVKSVTAQRFFLRQFRDAAVAVVNVRVFEHVDRAAAPVGEVFLAQCLALGLFLGGQVALARDARQLADAVHLFLCQGFALLSVFQAVQRGGDAPAAGDELRCAAAVDRHDRRLPSRPPNATVSPTCLPGAGMMRTAVVLLLIMPMAASSAMMAEIVSAGVSPGTAIMSRPTEHTHVMASSFSIVRRPASAAAIMPASSDTGMNAPESPPTWDDAMTPPFFHRVVEQRERCRGAGPADGLQSHLLEHGGHAVADGGRRRERQVHDAERHAQPRGRLLRHELAHARDAEGRLFHRLGHDVERLAMHALQRVLHHARPGHADVHLALRLAHAVKRPGHEGVVLHGVGKDHELGAGHAALIGRKRGGALDGAAHLGHGVHVDARARRADVHARAHQLRLRQRLRDGGDEHAVRFRHALVHERGKAAEEVDADLVRGAVERFGIRHIGLRARARSDEGDGRDGHALIDDGDAELGLDIFARAHEIARKAADLVVYLRAAALDVRVRAVEQGRRPS